MLILEGINDWHFTVCMKRWLPMLIPGEIADRQFAVLVNKQLPFHVKRWLPMLIPGGIDDQHFAVYEKVIVFSCEEAIAYVNPGGGLNNDILQKRWSPMSIPGAGKQKLTWGGLTVSISQSTWSTGSWRCGGGGNENYAAHYLRTKHGLQLGH